MEGGILRPLPPGDRSYTGDKFEYAPTPTDSVLVMEALQRAARNNADKIALRMPVTEDAGHGSEGMKLKLARGWRPKLKYEYKETTWKGLHEEVLVAGRSFLAQGLQPMDAVNIKGLNSPEWLIAFLGTIAAGGLPVGLYPTDALEALKYKAQDSEAKFVVVGSFKDSLKYVGSHSDAGEEEKFVGVLEQMDAGKRPTLVQWGDFTQTRELRKNAGEGYKILSWDDFLKDGKDSKEDSSRFNEWDALLVERMRAQRPGQAGSVVYTSGTTGNAKGVLLSQDALTWSAKAALDRIAPESPADGQDRLMSYLPLNHIAGQMLDIVGPIMRSTEAGRYETVYFPAKCFVKKKCFDLQLKDAKPTIFFGVPQVWDGMRAKLVAGLTALTFGPVKLGGVVSKLLPSVVLKKLGLQEMRYAGSGAGAITKDTLKFFQKLDISIQNLFGQSESSGVGTSWTKQNFDLTKLGSIGKPSADGILKICNVTNHPGYEEAKNDPKGHDPPGDEQCKEHEEGEILLKGRFVMLGYLNKLEKTKSTFTKDGWLRTGDLAKVDKDGGVWLTGRTKEIMKTYGGEMIAPNHMEEGIKKACNLPGEQLLSQVIVTMGGKDMVYPSVLVTLFEKLDEDNPTGDLDGGARRVSDAKKVEEAAKDPDWTDKLAQCIGVYNKGAQKKAERVYRFAVLPHDITRIHGNLMTPTFKIKRANVDKEYGPIIATCYKGETTVEQAASIKGGTVQPCGP